MPHRIPPLRTGHALRLLEGTAQYFPALVEAIDAARHEVLLESYIFDFTGASADVAHALERAARRGAKVRVVVDGYGTGEPPPDWAERLRAAGVAEEDLARVSSPCGLDIGARTPAETAIAILAEILALRAHRSGGRLAATAGPIHPRTADVT